MASMVDGPIMSNADPTACNMGNNDASEDDAALMHASLQPKLSFNRTRSVVLGKCKENLEEVYRLQAEAEEKERLAAAAAVETERAAAERVSGPALGAIENPAPQKAPGAGAHARPGGAEADNPVLLDVAGDQFSTNADKVALIMVGLPARGKTHVSRRLARYLNFFHSINVQVFNVGDYRRQLVKDDMPASFFDHHNEDAVKLRKQCSEAAMADMKAYLTAENDGRVAVYDATNTTSERRRWVSEQLVGLNIKVIFIEVICKDEKLIEANILNVKLNGPDYDGKNPEECVRDFRQRIKQYEDVYETIDCDMESDLSWIKIQDCRRYTINNVRGYLPGKIIQFLMCLHTTEKRFYLSRHGQSAYNAIGKIGGDSDLTPEGDAYARRLAEFAQTNITKDAAGKEIPARLWTSTMKRTCQTAQYIKHPVRSMYSSAWKDDDHGGRHQNWVQMRHKRWNNLDEIYAGVCDGMTYKEIERQMPTEWARRQQDKLAYRYPRGESYLDVIHRLDPIVHEMERIREPILIVGHQGILRIIYAYYMGLSREEAPYQSIPLNTVVELTPQTYGCLETRTTLQRRLSVPIDQVNPSGLANDGQDEIVPGRSSLETPTGPATPGSSTKASSLGSSGERVMNGGAAAETPTPRKFDTATTAAGSSETQAAAQEGADEKGDEVEERGQDRPRELSFDISDPPSV